MSQIIVTPKALNSCGKHNYVTFRMWQTADRQHSLGGSGSVQCVSVGNRVQLDRFWLPSLLHVFSRESAFLWNESREDGGTRRPDEQPVERKRSSAVTTCRPSAADASLNGWTWAERHKNVYTLVFRAPCQALIAVRPLPVTAGIAVLCSRGKFVHCTGADLLHMCVWGAFTNMV